MAKSERKILVNGDPTSSNPLRRHALATIYYRSELSENSAPYKAERERRLDRFADISPTFHHKRAAELFATIEAILWQRSRKRKRQDSAGPMRKRARVHS